MSIPKVATAVRRVDVQVTVANSNLDGTGTLATGIAGAAAVGWTVFDRVILKAIGTVTRNVLRLFLDNGTNKRLIGEIEVIPPAAQSATTTVWAGVIDGKGLRLIGTSDVIKITTENGDDFNCLFEATDFN